MFSTATSLPSPGDLRLSPGQLLTFTPAHPISLHLRCGGLWVTQAGDHRDHFLKAGQSMPLVAHRLTVLQAESGGVQAFLAPMVSGTSVRWPWRLLPKPWHAGHRFST